MGRNIVLRLLKLFTIRTQPTPRATLRWTMWSLPLLLSDLSLYKPSICVCFRLSDNIFEGFKVDGDLLCKSDFCDLFARYFTVTFVVSIAMLGFFSCRVYCQHIGWTHWVHAVCVLTMFDGN